MNEDVQLSIVVENKPNTLATLMKKLRDEFIEIKAIIAEGAGDRGIVRMIVNEPEKTGKILEKEGYKYAKDRVLVVNAKDNEELQTILNKLGTNNVNLKCIYLCDKNANFSSFILVCEDIERAKKVLGG